ncbi:hypothetical protein GCM10009682_14540 [Luedemannella flava]|uniref:Uncharacterized protein n=1 Tax=Luedemannella flava TaxID=349316 RepID=A0ABN2LP84_9ACTN
MTEPEREQRPNQLREGYLQKRRNKVREEIERNRRGEYVVPTWVLVAALLLVLAAFAILLIFF